jgi:hypothetical protein
MFQNFYFFMKFQTIFSHLQRHASILLTLATLAATPNAHAILSFNDSSHQALTPGVLGGALDGVGRVTLVTQSSPGVPGWLAPTPGGQFTGYCTANLLSGGQYAITAAHCVDNDDAAQVSFLGGAVTRQVTQATVNSGWFGRNFGSDVALLRLDRPVTEIQGYQLASMDATNNTVLLAGYGRVGTGSTGWVDPNLQGVGYYGFNRYDMSMSTRDGRALNGSVYGFDFDNGTRQQDTICLLYGVCDLGLGVQEVSIALGDSGGGSFIWSGTHWLLVGLHSHGAEYLRRPCSFDASLQCGDVNDVVFDSSFGEVFWDASLLPHLGWINGFLNASNEVPEPDTALLLAMGLVGLTLQAKRKRNS